MLVDRKERGGEREGNETGKRRSLTNGEQEGAGDERTRERKEGAKRESE